MKLLLALITTLSSSAYAVTDYTCVSSCTAKGTMFQVCEKRCTAPEGYGYQATFDHVIDWPCVNQCTSQPGRNYDVCVKQCSD